MEGVHVVEDRARESGGRKSPSGIQNKAPVGSLGDKVPQKLKQNVKLAYNL